MPQELSAEEMRSVAVALVDAVNARDFEAVSGLIDPEGEFVSALGAMEGETHVGVAGLRAWAAAMDEIWTSFRVEIIDFRKVREDCSVVVYRNIGEARQSGIPIDIRSGQVWTWREGKVWRNRSYTDPAEALNAVGLQE